MRDHFIHALQNLTLFCGIRNSGLICFAVRWCGSEFGKQTSDSGVKFECGTQRCSVEDARGLHKGMLVEDCFCPLPYAST